MMNEEQVLSAWTEDELTGQIICAECKWPAPKEIISVSPVFCIPNIVVYTPDECPYCHAKMVDWWDYLEYKERKEAEEDE